MVLATPVLPPAASAQAKAGRGVPGGVGGLIGGSEVLGPETIVVAGVSVGLATALGPRLGPQAVRIEIKRAVKAKRIGQWYGREPPVVRRGGGTDRKSTRLNSSHT